MTRKKIAFVVCILLLIWCGIYIKNGYIQSKESTDMLMKEYMNTVSASQYIRHALGGLEDKYNYTNSYEALVESYNKGFRLFEADVCFTSDDILVLSHGWEKIDYLSRMGIPYNEGHVPTYAEFKGYQFHDQFTPMAFKDLVDFMKEHHDMFVMVDLGKVHYYEGTKKAYEAIVRDAEHDDDILKRLITGGHNTDMIKAVKEVYDFPLINLYLPKSSVIEDALRDYDNFSSYCHANGITSFSTSIKIYNDQNIGENMKNSGLIQYVFTINDEALAAQTIEKGASVIGTDFLE